MTFVSLTTVLVFGILSYGCVSNQDSSRASTSAALPYSQEYLEVTNWSDRKKRMVRTSNNQIFVITEFIRDHLPFTEGNMCYLIRHEEGKTPKIVGVCK